MSLGAPLSNGTLLHDRYEVQGFLGGGTYGQVYRVHDLNLDTHVALKLLKPLPDTPPDWVEAQLLQRLQSTFLLPVLNAAVIPGVDLRYITTPLATGGDLGKAAGRFGTRVRLAIRWCQQVSTGLARIHDDRLLHRDIKPENVFLAENRTALLGDLGLAAAMASDGTADATGTQYTAAPELFGGARCSVATDIYSVGVTAFILLTGRWPRGHGGTPSEVAKSAVAGTGPALQDLSPHVPRAVVRVVERAMALNPVERHASCCRPRRVMTMASWSV